MNINLSISAAPSIIDKIAVVVYAADAPGVIVDSQEFDPPHLVPRNITFTDLEPKSYLVNTYETTGLPTLGTLRHSFQYDASFIGAEYKLTEFLYMTGGATSYTDTDWIGWTVESIERRGVGSQYTEANFDESIPAEISIREDGFDLAQEGDSFGDQEKWIVRFYPKINTIDPVYRSAKIIRSYLTIDSDITLTEDEAGVGLLLKGASSHFVITMPEISTIENALMYVFISDGGQHVGVTIQRTGTTDKFDLRGDRNYIELAQGDRMWISNDNSSNKWILSKEPESWFRTGQIIERYHKPANAYDESYVFADGSSLDRTVYKRLYDYYTALPSSAKVSKVSWDANINQQGKWHDGDGSTTFGVPRLYSAGFMRAINGSTRLPGSYEADGIGTQEVTITAREAATAGGNDGIPNVTLVDSEMIAPFTGDYIDYPVTLTAGDETKPKNYGIYKLIAI